MEKFILTVVVAVKEWREADVLRLVYSLSVMPLAKKMQMVLVFSNNSPESMIVNLNSNIGSFKFIDTAPQGVYAAFTAGVAASEGSYIIFSGGDDFFMPGLNKILKLIPEMREKQSSLIVSPVCFGDDRLFLPSKSKLGILLKNWCQQGVLYRSDIFEKYHFDEKYPIQADHKFNIELLASNNISIQYTDFIVAYFSCGGMSQTKPDLLFWKDMPSIVLSNFGWIYATVCRLRMMVGYVLHGSPKKRFKAPIEN